MPTNKIIYKRVNSLAKAKSGQAFKASISDRAVKGHLVKESGCWYLLQNIKVGSCPDNEHLMLKYKASWTVSSGTILDIKEHEVSDLYLGNDYKKVPKLPLDFPLNEEYSVTFHKGYIKVGCQIISNVICRKIVKKLIT